MKGNVTKRKLSLFQHSHITVINLGFSCSLSFTCFQNNLFTSGGDGYFVHMFIVAALKMAIKIVIK